MHVRLVHAVSWLLPHLGSSVKTVCLNCAHKLAFRLMVMNGELGYDYYPRGVFKFPDFPSAFDTFTFLQAEAINK